MKIITDVFKILCWIFVCILLIFSANHFREMVMDYRLERTSMENDIENLKKEYNEKITLLNQRNEIQQMQINVLLYSNRIDTLKYKKE